MRYTQSILSIVLALSIGIALTPAWARGGGGGGRGGGGFGGRGDFGGRGGGDRDFDNFNRGFDRGPDDQAGRGFDSFQDTRPSAFDSGARPSESDLQAGANRTYGDQRSLATDGGFDRLSSAAAGRYTPGAHDNTSRLSAADLGARADDVRNGYHDYDAFNRGWWGRHPDAWYYGRWGDDWAWGGVGWDDLGGWWGLPVDGAPIDYDYGNNITYQNDEVYYGSQPTATASTYYAQAQTLATSVPATTKPSSSATTSKDWKPLGVYSITQGTQSNTTTLFQLAVDKKGTIRGNYYNALTQETKPVQGAVDKKDMRAAWTVGTDKNVVYDTGLANLLKNQSTLLVHIGKTQTQQWNLIKLQQPKK